MGLFVSTVSGNVSIPELGITLTHPVTDYDIGGQFSSEDVKNASSLTTAINAGTLTWRKVAAGAVQPAADYDADFLEIDRENTGTGKLDDRATTFKDLNNSLDIAASPGFTWGRSGNVPSGTYLQNDTVPSNTAGRVVPVTSAYIAKVIVSCELIATFSIQLLKRSGASFVLLTTVNMVAQRTGTFAVNVPVTLGDELVVSLSAGSARNVVVGVIIRGTTA